MHPGLRSFIWAVCVAIALGSIGCPQGGEEAVSPAGASRPVKGAVGTTSAGNGYSITHLVEGDGASPKATDQVLVHYHGTFPDGSVFDSSVERGEPARFPLDRVISCWTLGLQQIRVGGKALLVCQPEVAYGARGAPPRIPPNATLHFEVELLAIE